MDICNNCGHEVDVYIPDEKIIEIIKIFADGIDEKGIYGHDTKICDNWAEAIKWVREILER